MQDVRELAPPVLRHRILLNYKAEAEGITVDQMIARLLDPSKAPAQARPAGQSAASK